MIRLLGLSLILLFSLSWTGCKKYEEGPSISLKSKKARLVGDWKIKVYERNGVEETGLLLFQGYIERYMDDGTYTREYTRFDGTSFFESGSWEFSDNKEQIILKGVNDIELTNETGLINDSIRTIWMLRSDGLKYRYDQGQYTHHFHMTPLE